jgi:hypothetical protein
MTYTPLNRSAQRLGTDEETLHRFRRLGWIASVEKGGAEYLEDHQEYKARFILYLQRERGLNTLQIGKVLAEQKPPYSAAKVGPVPPTGRSGERIH